MAARKAGNTSFDIAEPSALGNNGRNSRHMAGQMQRKYCQNEAIDVPCPYTLDCPVLLKSSEGVAVVARKIGMLLPHEWFHWMGDKDGVSGLSELAKFWATRPHNDPQLSGNLVGVTWLVP